MLLTTVFMYTYMYVCVYVWMDIWMHACNMQIIAYYFRDFIHIRHDILLYISVWCVRQNGILIRR